VPHPGIAERAFVLAPLAEVAPDLDVPGVGRVRMLAAGIDTAGLARMAA
jgi:2-amino-4-hydroxy-6-hydroxymethyldihydropteridine diphosphokinase